MAYRLLGSAVTDANGKAVYEYTGTGAGKVDIVASEDNPITGSSVQSRKEITDAIFFDSGILNDSHRNTNWTYYLNTVSEGVADSNGTTFKNETSGNGALVLANVGEPTPYMTPARDYHYPYCVEVDIVEVTGTAYLINVDSVQKFFPSLSSEHHIKLWTNDSGTMIYWTIDGGTTQSYPAGQMDVNEGVGFRIEANSSVKYKNFYIYPI